jgi:tetratricopeptide (TPR) repeat protein
MKIQHLVTTDRTASWRVSNGVGTLVVSVVFVVFAAACGGKTKPEPTVAGPAGQRAPSADSTTADEAPMAAPPADGASDVSDPTLALGAGPTPPGLDLPEAEKRSRVVAHVRAGKHALAQKNPEAAGREAQSALALDETSLDAMIVLAHANYMKGYLDLAEDILNKAEKRGGTARKELHFLRGLIYERTERQNEALAAFEKAVAIDPNYKSGLINLGAHYLKNKRFDQAVEVYERLTGSMKVEEPQAIVNLGTAYRGRSAEAAASNITERNALLLKAQATYQRALSRHPNYAPAYYNMGLLYLDADPFPESGKDMDKLARLDKARTYFEQYKGKPGANQKLASDQLALTANLADRERSARKKLEDAERRRKEADSKAKDLEKDQGGFE